MRKALEAEQEEMRNRLAARSADARALVLHEHYTIKQLAQKWQMSTWTIRRIFEKEPDVVRVGQPPTPGKRPHFSIRIPDWVAYRVYKKFCEKQPSAMTRMNQGRRYRL
jgi:hypothetical protein